MKENYRPITILSCFSKVFERLVHKQLSQHFENILHKNAFAYRKNRGCETALLYLTEEWKADLDAGKSIGIVSMDLSKAFDSVPHDLTIEKLRQYGIDNKTVNLMDNYLTNRYQRVRLNGEFSNWQLTNMGIPQGSILGPLIFNIFMNDLFYVIENSTLSTYADDTQIFYSDHDTISLQRNINNDLLRADKWFDENAMKRNNDKYQSMVLGEKNNMIIPNFTCDDHVVSKCEQMELLGVTLDNKLKFEAHIQKVCRKVGQQLSALHRLKKILPLETRRDIYFAFILPHFNYCSETWHHCSKRNTSKLEKINERAVRLVFNDNSTHYETLLKKLKLKTLAEQRKQKIILNVFKSLNSDSSPINDLLTFSDSPYNLRYINTLKLPKVRTSTYGSKSWRFLAAKLWNNLPNKLRTIKEFTELKKQLKDIDFL